MVHSLPENIARGLSNVPSLRGRYVKANFSRDTITLPNLIMAQCNVKANFRESRDTITLPNLIMAKYNVKANFIESHDTITLPNLIMAQCNVSDKTK